MNTAISEEVAQRILKSNEGQALAKEIVLEQYKERVELVDKLAHLHNELERQGKAYKKAEPKLAKTLANARAAVTTALKKYNEAKKSKRIDSAICSNSISNVEQSLMQTAPHIITEFIEWLRSEEQATRENRVVTRKVATGNTYKSLRAEKKVVSNVRWIEQRLILIRSLLDQAKQLQLRALPIEKVETQLRQWQQQVEQA